MTRLEKVKLVGGFEPSFDSLDVCVGDPTHRSNSERPNCSDCYKCRRQLVTLDLLGVLDSYETVFDIENYRVDVSKAMTTIAFRALSVKQLSNCDMSDVDIILLAQKQDRLAQFDFKKVMTVTNLSWKLRTKVAAMIGKSFAKRVPAGRDGSKLLRQSGQTSSGRVT